ncbi:TPA: hypothetical protein ACPTM7_003660, partial [Escherichia coli]
QRGEFSPRIWMAGSFSHGPPFHTATATGTWLAFNPVVYVICLKFAGSRHAISQSDYSPAKRGCIG